VVNEVYRVIVGTSGHSDQFPYIVCCQDAVLSQPTWLRTGLEEACRILVARVVATSKCREKTKGPVLAGEPNVPFYPPLPPAPSSTPQPLTLDEEAQGTVTPVKSVPEAPGTPTPLTSLSPMDPMPILSPPVPTPHPLFDWGHLTSLCEDPSSPQTTAALQMPLREAQSPMYYDQEAKYRKEDRHLPISPLPPQTSSTGKIIPPLSWKSLRL
jgi:hypothetical protein